MKYFIIIGIILSSQIVLLPQIIVHADSPVPSTIDRGDVKEVALTFDDGPYGTSTQSVLDILKSKNVHATFFVLGKNVNEYPFETKEIVVQGNAIGNHTYTHTKNLTTMSEKELDTEISMTEVAIASTTGVTTHLFRPPYGNITKHTRKIIETLGYHIVLWNVDPRDWNYAHSSTDTIVKKILSSTSSHMDILLHDGRDTKVNYPRDNMIKALPEIIDSLKARGYTFITLK